MAFQIFRPEEIEWAEELLTISPEDNFDDILDDESGLEVGHSVKIVRKGSRGEDLVGVIVQANEFGTYVVEPYNYPYYNDPRNITKLGPYSAKDLKKVRKPKGASTEFDETGLANYQKQDTLTAAELVQELSEKGSSKSKKKTRKKAGNSKREKLRNAMSGNENKLTTDPTKARKTAAVENKETDNVNDNAEEVRATVNASNDLPRAAQVALANGTMPKLTKGQKQKLDAIINERGDGDITKAEMLEVSENLFGKKFALNWIRKYGPENRAGRGVYSLKALVAAANQ